VTRVLIFTLVGLGLMVALGPIQRYLGLEIVVVDVPLITLLYMAMAGRGVGMTRPPSRTVLFSRSVDWSGGLTGFALGYLQDLLGGGLKGLHCLSMTLMFVLSVWAARHVYLAGSLSVVTVSAVASLLASLICLIVRSLAGGPLSRAAGPVVCSQAMRWAAVAPSLMRLFRYLDGKLARDPADRGSLCQ